MRIPRRTKRKYMELHDDPARLFASCEVILWPNGEPEIWIRSKDQRRGFRIKAGDGPAGLGLDISGFTFGTDITVSGNLAPDYEVYPPKGEERRDFRHISLCEYRRDSWSQRFRDWYAGRGEHPGDAPEKREDVWEPIPLEGQQGA